MVGRLFASFACRVPASSNRRTIVMANKSFESAGASNSLTVRLKIGGGPGAIGKVATLIGTTFKADVGAMDIIGFEDGCTVRDITFSAGTVERGEEIVEALRKMENVEVVNVSDRTFLAHLGGKLVVRPRNPIRNRDDLSMVYTPGVARVCLAIHKDPSKAYSLTMKKSTIAII